MDESHKLIVSSIESLARKQEQQEVRMYAQLEQVEKRTLARIDETIKLIVTPIRVEMVEIKENLAEHMRRTEANENRIVLVEDRFKVEDDRRKVSDERHEKADKLRLLRYTRIAIIVPIVVALISLIAQYFYSGRTVL